MTQTLAVKEIDKMHLSANTALKNKDIKGYLEIFSDDLRYTQANGKTIDKRTLAHDIDKYFTRIIQHNSRYERKKFLIENNVVIETLIQHASVRIKVFLFFSKSFSIEREGIYKWRECKLPHK